MLLENESGVRGLDRTTAHESRFLNHDEPAPMDRAASLSRHPAIRCTVHVVADSAQERAAMARLVFSAGHHAEVYSDAFELVAHRPAEGLVFAHESERCSAEATCRILAEGGLWLPVVGFGGEVSADRIVAGMKAGAIDFIIGSPSAAALSSKLPQCMAEARTVYEMRSRRANARSLIAKLSQREREVLDLLSEGLSNKEMARDLEISPRTVEIHRMKMLSKLGANSSAHAIRIRISALD